LTLSCLQPSPRAGRLLRLVRGRISASPTATRVSLTARLAAAFTGHCPPARASNPRRRLTSAKTRSPAPRLSPLAVRAQRQLGSLTADRPRSPNSATFLETIRRSPPVGASVLNLRSPMMTFTLAASRPRLPSSRRGPPRWQERAPRVYPHTDHAAAGTNPLFSSALMSSNASPLSRGRAAPRRGCLRSYSPASPAAAAAS